MKPTKLNRFQTFAVCWGLGGVSYLTDCLIVSTFDHPPDVAGLNAESIPALVFCSRLAVSSRPS